MKRIVSKLVLLALIATVAAPAHAGFALSKENTTKLALATGLAALAGGSFYYANKNKKKDKKINITPVFVVSILGLLALLHSKKN